MSSEKTLDLTEVVASLPGQELTADERATIIAEIQEKSKTLLSDTPMPESVKQRLVALQLLQRNHDALHEKFLEEKAALEAKYQGLYAPLYSKRHDIVTGAVDIASEQAGEPAASDEESAKGIPEFWLTAMKNNEILAEQVTVRDEGCLKYLKDITWSHLGGESKGFKLEFHFDVNPYFKNSVLVKSYHMIDEEEPILEKAEGTDIEWFPAKNLTVKVLKKKPKKGAKNAKPVTKTEPCESFFNFFSPPAVPSEDEELDEEEAEELQDLMEQDYDVGSVLKEKIIPQAVSWFTGEAAAAEYGEGLDGDDDDEDGDDGEDGEDDDDDDDDDEDEVEQRPVKPTRGKGRR